MIRPKMVGYGVLIFLCMCVNVSAEQTSTVPVNSLTHSAYFFLTSDQLRALRDTKPKSTLVLKWTKHVDILDGKSDKPADTSGTLTLGPDYLEWRRNDGGASIIDFALRRMIYYTPGKTGFNNTSLYVRVDSAVLEAMNRERMSRIRKILKRMGDTPGFVQYLYEAELGVTTPNITPIKVKITNTDKSVTVHYKDESIAETKFGQTILTDEQRSMFAKALRYHLKIHPLALKAMIPFSRLPSEISSVHAFEVKSKARTTLHFELVGTNEAGYPLPSGLKPSINDTSFVWNNKIAKLVATITDTALSSLSGTYSKKRQTFDDYVADATRAAAAGDHLESGLAWIAATSQFPDKISSCDTATKPSYCSTYKEQITAANTDPQFALVTRGALACIHHKAEESAKSLARVNSTDKPHGYVVSMLLFCALTELPQQKPGTIAGVKTKHPVSPIDNAIDAIKGNPYIPSYYYDVGTKLAMIYEHQAAWRMYDLGLALGGGRKGDAFDTDLRKREQAFLSDYPEYF